MEADQEEDMSSTFAGDIQGQIEAGRKTIERSLSDVREMEMPEIPPAVIAAGVVAAVVAVGVIGWMVFRSRQRRPLLQRVQEAIPGSVRDLPTGLRARVRRAK
jgi:cytochrome c-type biogenesis protein CcmH/NrfG